MVPWHSLELASWALGFCFQNWCLWIDSKSYLQNIQTHGVSELYTTTTFERKVASLHGIGYIWPFADAPKAKGLKEPQFTILFTSKPFK